VPSTKALLSYDLFAFYSPIRYILMSVSCEMTDAAKEVQGCWAASLSDCDGGISREHLISECLFSDKEIVVKGFSWRPEEKPIRIEALVSKILCVKHNRELSELDANAKRTFEALTESINLWNARSMLRNRHWTIQEYFVDMRLLERWCLKTLINLHYEGQWYIDSASLPGVPSKELVEIVFGRRAFTDSAGLYTQAKSGDSMIFHTGITVGATTQGQNLVAGRFNLWGYRFVLSLLPYPIGTNDGSHLLHRETKCWFRTKDFKDRNVKSHIVTFEYRN
jgi:hypothetical protein